MRTEAQAAADKVGAEVQALANKLATDDFPISRPSSRELRFDSANAWIAWKHGTEKMEARLLDAIREDPAHREASTDTPEAADSP